MKGTESEYAHNPLACHEKQFLARQDISQGEICWNMCLTTS